MNPTGQSLFGHMEKPLYVVGRALTAIGFIGLILVAHFAFGPLLIGNYMPSGLTPVVLACILAVVVGGLGMLSSKILQWIEIYRAGMNQ